MALKKEYAFGDSRVEEVEQLKPGGGSTGLSVGISSAAETTWVRLRRSFSMAETAAALGQT